MKISDNELLHMIICSYSEQPRDVATMPKNNKEPKWYYVYTDGSDIFIDSGWFHTINKSRVKPHTKLDKHNLGKIHEMFNRYKLGLVKRHEIRDMNYSSSYWFGIFKDLQL